MSGGTELALCFGTVVQAGLIELIEAAGEAGLPAITVAPHLYLDARAAGSTDGELRRRLDDAGVRVAAVEPLFDPLPGPPPAASLAPLMTRLASVSEANALRAATALGAPLVSLVQPMGADVEWDHLVDVVGGVATRAQAEGLAVAVEFMPNWKAVPDVATALALRAAVGPSLLGVVFDVWHHHRGGGELPEVEPGAVAVVQICDAPAGTAGRAPQPMEDRLLPGEGVIPVRSLVAGLTAGSPGAVVSIEVFSARLAALPPGEAAREAAAAGHRTLDANEGQPSA